MAGANAIRNLHQLRSYPFDHIFTFQELSKASVLIRRYGADIAAWRSAWFERGWSTINPL